MRVLLIVTFGLALVFAARVQAAPSADAGIDAGADAGLSADAGTDSGEPVRFTGTVCNAPEPLDGCTVASVGHAPHSRFGMLVVMLVADSLE